MSVSADIETTVSYDEDGLVATLTLNRPRALNAFTMDMEELLAERIRQADAGRFWSEWHQRLGAMSLEFGGPSSLILDDGRLDGPQRAFLFSRQDTIAAGSSEIQRNILAERVVGLP